MYLKIYPSLNLLEISNRSPVSPPLSPLAPLGYTPIIIIRILIKIIQINDINYLIQSIFFLTYRLLLKPIQVNVRELKLFHLYIKEFNFF